MNTNNNSSGSNGPTSNSASSMYNYTHFKDTKYKNAQGTPNRNFQPVPYTEEEHQRIQYLLDKVLGPEYVSFRQVAEDKKFRTLKVGERLTWRMKYLGLMVGVQS
jgi:hypothetical protein